MDCEALLCADLLLLVGEECAEEDDREVVEGAARWIDVEDLEVV